MRKFAVGLMVLASAIICNAANAGHEGFFRSPVISHHPFFFHKPFFGNHRFSNFSFPVIFAPYYPYYAPYYLSYDYEANESTVKNPA